MSFSHVLMTFKNVFVLNQKMSHHFENNSKTLFHCITLDEDTQTFLAEFLLNVIFKQIFEFNSSPYKCHGIV